jgi:hypothetical protein
VWNLKSHISCSQECGRVWRNEPHLEFWDKMTFGC